MSIGLVPLGPGKELTEKPTGVREGTGFEFARLLQQDEEDDLRLA